MKQQKHEPHKKGPTVVTISDSSFTAHTKQPLLSSNSNNSHRSSAGTAAPEYDIIMCGETLDIMVALALQQQGFKVAVVEKRVVQGRVQEWNTSRHECQVGVEARVSMMFLYSTAAAQLNRLAAVVDRTLSSQLLRRDMCSVLVQCYTRVCDSAQ